MNNNLDKRDWFLETSVPRNLQFGHSLIKEEIKQHIKGVKCWSSYYVLMEYKRSVLKTLIDLYFVASEENTPSDALHYFSQGFKTRETKIVLDAIAELSKEPDVINDKKRFLVKLETLILAANQYFEDLIEGYVENKTHCPHAKASIKGSYDRFVEEIDCKKKCSVERLWKKSKGLLKLFVEEGGKQPHSSNKGFTKSFPLIESIIKDPKIAKTKTNCMNVGDFVIGLEMPKHLRMLTFDNAFKSICPIIGKEFFILSSLAALKKK
jgi:hypothetical protein